MKKRLRDLLKQIEKCKEDLIEFDDGTWEKYAGPLHQEIINNTGGD